MDTKGLHESFLNLKFGKKFPKINEEFEIIHPDFGVCMVHVVDIDRYEWVTPGEVETTIMYYILEVLEPSPQYRIQQLGLKVMDKEDKR
ncbi:hypothetical protein [Ectobacillus panaciterrae]|uniref:hypothetical protein n=1 Tax=Ectobacillus panaciterrae TaxID=363872 RepID=UPI000490916F|nr:hypothetical protein [Ectobacillus panaciterrae]